MVNEAMPSLDWTVKVFFNQRRAPENLDLGRASHILQRRACSFPHTGLFMGPPSCLMHLSMTHVS